MHVCHMVVSTRLDVDIAHEHHRSGCIPRAFVFMCSLLTCDDVFSAGTPLQRDELMWDCVFKEVPDGFSCDRPQIYATAGWGVTMPHDELMDFSAANYMVSCSCAHLEYVLSL